jgi:hypothetical protein
MMKKRMSFLAGIFLFAGLVSHAQDSAEPFLGNWALSLDYPDNNAGWLEVRQEKGYLDSDILWRWGSVDPVDFTMVSDATLLLVRGSDVIRKKDEKGNPLRTTHPVYWYSIEKDGEGRITGEAIFPEPDGTGVEKVKFTGKRVPPPGNPPDLSQAKYGKPVKLFNGKNLDGWKLLGVNTVSGWKVENGELVNDPVQPDHGKHINYGNLATTDTFNDFKLHIEANVPAESNSGIYLRGMYEVQVLDSYGKPLDQHNMGALYSRITPSVAAEKPAGEWQELDITLYKRHLTVVLNGTNIIDNQPVKGVTGGALTADVFSPGPLYLQGDHLSVRYRNIVLTPIVE